MRITALVENTTKKGWRTEHGLSLFIETERHRILFDTGQGDLFAENAQRAGVDLKQADICVIEMPLLDTRRGKDLMGTFLSDIVLQVLSFVAENERMTIRQRQAEGIAAARIRGVRFGRVPLAPPDNFEEIVQAWKAHEISIGTALKRSRMSRSTFFRKRRELGMLETPEAGGVWKGDS